MKQMTNSMQGRAGKIFQWGNRYATLDATTPIL
jgi:hypothetical protein